MVSYDVFNFHFPNGWWYWLSFHGLICHPCILYGEVSIQVLYSFFQLCYLFSCCWAWEFFVCSGYKFFVECIVFKYSLLSHILSFRSHDSSFRRTKGLNLTKSNSSSFCLLCILCLVSFKNSLPNPRSQGFILCFS